MSIDVPAKAILQQETLADGESGPIN